MLQNSFRGPCDDEVIGISYDVYLEWLTRSINSLLYSSPAEVGNATGLPCSAWISERVGLLDFAGGTTSTRGYR